MFTLAHLSDVHLPLLHRPKWAELIGKRMFGYVNWQMSRLHIHTRPVLDRIVADLKTQTPDHIAITGDLTNLGLVQEFISARSWIEDLGTPETVSVIPGNHDAYVPLWSDAGWDRWRAFMTTNTPDWRTEQSHKHAFPFVRTYDQIALIGLSSAIHTPPMNASGRIGRKQRSALAEALKTLKDQAYCRIVLIHHPPLPGQSTWNRRLRDASSIKSILHEHGAELVLCGHNHQWALDYADSRENKIPIVQAPSASQATTKALAGYNLLQIAPEKNGWHIELIRRGLTGKDGNVTELKRTALTTS